MPLFHFAVVDRDGAVPDDDVYEFPTVDAACREARKVLAEMALDGLPAEPTNMYVIEVQDSQRHPLVRLRLILETMAARL